MSRSKKGITLFLNFILTLCISYYLVCFLNQTIELVLSQKFFLFIYFGIVTFAVLYWLYKKGEGIYNQLNFYLLFMIACLLLCFNKQIIPKKYENNIVKINVLDNKDIESMGMEVWLNKIILEGKEQYSSNFIEETEEGFWKINGMGLFTSYSSDASELVLQFPKKKSAQLVFGKHAWSGMIEVDINGDRSIYNLYDEKGGALCVDILPQYKEYSVFEKMIFFIGSVFGFYIILQMLFRKKNFVSIDLKKENNNALLIDDSQRHIGIDILKTIAIFFVISIHFCLNTSFYSTKLEGEVMFLQLVSRWIFYTCVPLFLLCTGFLQGKKEYNKRYWARLGEILFSYVVISLVCYIYRICYLHEGITFRSALTMILKFSLDGYSWYIGMFIGLYLLIPAFNILYNNLGERKNKFRFIILLCILSSYPISMFSNNWWINFYPIMFYFIGLYIREYEPKFEKIKCIVLITLLVLGEALLTYFSSWKNSDGIFNATYIDSYGSLLNILVAVLVFLLFYNCRKCGILISSFFKSISSLTLDIYLFSFIFDLYFYPKFKEKYFVTQQDFTKYYFIIVLFVFLFSYMAAYIVNQLKKALFARK